MDGPGWVRVGEGECWVPGEQAITGTGRRTGVAACARVGMLSGVGPPPPAPAAQPTQRRVARPALPLPAHRNEAVAQALGGLIKQQQYLLLLLPAIGQSHVLLQLEPGACAAGF